MFCTTWLLLLISACATPGISAGSVFHSLSIINKSSAIVQGIKVKYGRHDLEFAGKFPAFVGRRTYASDMHVPTAIEITWEDVGGVRLSQDVPINLRGISARKLAALQIVFTDAGIEIHQGVDNDMYSRSYLKIYPGSLLSG